MARSNLSRRDFLRASAMAAVGVVAASCAQPTPEVIEKEVPVEKIVKETVVVEKQVPVEKVVKETVVVEKQVAIEKVVTATPIPAKYSESPMLAAKVKA
ncbi:MAG: twin-arginine translocation signal domain-containing protein, partial [Chloroflexi bacterium]|nr:twin-arginine translocation signal domain-containing protein [Chloroflexota bacterium]